MWEKKVNANISFSRLPDIESEDHFKLPTFQFSKSYCLILINKNKF